MAEASDFFISSEEIARTHSADVFAKSQATKKPTLSEKDKLRGFIEAQILKHSSTTSVRAMAKKNDRTNDYQLDLSADIVEILEKIKSDLGK